MSDSGDIDLDHLEKYVAGDDALRDEILGMFAEQLGVLTERFDIDGSDEDWRDVNHALKGAARSVGAWKLGELCAQAEGLIGEIAGKREKRAALMISIRGKISTTVDALEALRANAA